MYVFPAFIVIVIFPFASVVSVESLVPSFTVTVFPANATSFESLNVTSTLNSSFEQSYPGVLVTTLLMLKLFFLISYVLVKETTVVLPASTSNLFVESPVPEEAVPSPTFIE